MIAELGSNQNMLCYISIKVQNSSIRVSSNSLSRTQNFRDHNIKRAVEEEITSSNGTTYREKGSDLSTRIFASVKFHRCQIFHLIF